VFWYCWRGDRKDIRPAKKDVPIISGVSLPEKWTKKLEREPANTKSLEKWR